MRGRRRRPRRACSGWARRARAATPRTCGCPGVQADLLDGARWPPARRSSWSSSRAARTRWATCTAGPPASSRRSCPARRAGRPSPGSCPAGSSPAASCRCRSRGRRAGSRAPTCSRRSALPRATASATSTRPRCSRSGTARSYTTFAVDDLRISDAEVPDRRRVHRVGAGPQHRRAGPARRSSSSTCTTWSPRWPGRCCSSSASPASGWSPARRRTCRSACTRTGPRSPVATCGASSSRGTSRCCVGTSAADLPCRGTVRLTGPLRVVGARPPTGHAGGRGPPHRVLAPRVGRNDAVPVLQTGGDAGHGRGLGRRVGRDRVKVLNGRGDVAPATRSLVQPLLQQHDYVAAPQRRGATRPARHGRGGARRGAQRLLDRDRPGRGARPGPRSASPSS